MTQKRQSEIPRSGTDSLAQQYDDYLGPLFFEPYAMDVANLIDPSVISNALEIGCGTGRVTRHLSSILSPNSRLVASDISEDMLAVAKDLDPIDEDIANAGGILHRLLESRAVVDCRRIEQDDIRGHSGRQAPPGAAWRKR